MSLKVEGLDEAAQLLQRITKAGYMKKPLQMYGQRIRARTAPYPAKPPHSTYRRTGNLGRKWYTKSGSTQVEVGNRARYAGWVQSKPLQRDFHKRTGWRTIEDVAEQEFPQFMTWVAQEIARIMK